MDLTSELARLTTFRNWTQTGQPVRLSRRGFYAAGRGRTVVCYLCRSEFDDWNDVDELFLIHRIQSPRCTAGRSSQNGPTSSLYSDRDVTDFGVFDLRDVRTENTRVNYAPAAVSRSTIPDFDRLRFERVRLETFENWPPLAARVVDPRDLAEAGLFYIGQRDRVQCVFCRGYLYSWVIGDIPIDEHRKHFPDCPFLRGMDVGNVRCAETNSDMSNGTSASNARYYTDSSFQNSAADGHIYLTETPPPVQGGDGRELRAKHPAFVGLSIRIESYRGKRVGDGQTAEGLAQAGFFYIGPEDNVRCFQCDGGLKNWQPTDDPWTEHARWFPRCPFLLAHRDQTFIKDAQIPTNEVKNVAFAHTSASSGRVHVEMPEIKTRMDSATAQAVIDMGYSRELVRQVIERRLAIAGEDFPNTQSLLDAIFETEDDPSLQRYPSDAGSYNSFTTSSLRSTHAFQSTASTPIVLSRSEIPRAPTPSDQRSLSSLDILRPETPDQASTPRVSSVSEVPRAPTPIDQRLLSSLDNVRLETRDQDVERTLEENRRLREAMTCSVCMDKEVNTVFLPCGHLVCCNECSQSLTNCAVCRALVRGTVKIFLS